MLSNKGIGALHNHFCKVSRDGFPFNKPSANVVPCQIATPFKKQITLDKLPAILINKGGFLTIAWAQKEDGIFVNFLNCKIPLDKCSLNTR